MRARNEITREEFEGYEKVRASGLTNMFDVKMVEFLSGLSRDEILEIIQQYNELTERYPEVRKT